jgi:C-terminal processing protease CtpA/Prc
MNAKLATRLGIGVIIIGLIAAGTYWLWPHRKAPTKPSLVVAGVGLYLGRNQETHKFEVRKVFPNSPAEKAGVMPGLVLNKVNDTLAETNTIKGLSALLMGPVGSKVMVELIDTNGTAETVEMIREKFVNKSTQ